jgi:hypothetical protein
LEETADLYERRLLSSKATTPIYNEYEREQVTANVTVIQRRHLPSEVGQAAERQSFF